MADLATNFSMRSSLVEMGGVQFMSVLTKEHLGVLLLGNDLIFRRDCVIDAFIVIVYALVFQNKICRIVSTIRGKCPEFLNRIDYATLCKSIFSAGGLVREPKQLHIEAITTDFDKKGNLIDKQTGCILKEGRENCIISDHCLVLAALLTKGVCMLYSLFRLLKCACF